MTLYLKDPFAEVAYLVDWGGELSGRTIATAAWTVAPAEEGGVAVSDAAIDGATTRVTIAGGLAGRVYRVTGHAVFSDGRGDARALTLRVDAR